MLLRKMLSNRWLVLSLLAGIVLAIALVAGIPIYTAGLLKRMLVRDLELFQSSRRLYPGHYCCVARRLYRIMADELSPERLQAALDLPIVSHCHNLCCMSFPCSSLWAQACASCASIRSQ